MKNLFRFGLSGLLLAASWPTYGFAGFIFIAFVPLLWGIESILHDTGKRKFLRVFLFGYLSMLLWNYITTYWLRYASEVGGWFAVLVNSLLMANLLTLYFWVRKKTTPKTGLVFLAALWISFEKFHLNWDFSWPWLNLGNVFAGHPTWIQWYEYTGSFGGSLWVWTSNIVVFWTLSKGIKPSIYGAARQFLPALLIIFIPIAVSLALYATYTEEKNPVDVVVLQPNIDPYKEKYLITNETVFKHLYDLSKDKIDTLTDFWIAPETVFAKGTRLEQLDNSVVNLGFQELTRLHPNLNVLTGISLYEVYNQPVDATSALNSQTLMDGGTIWFNDFNSAYFLNKNLSTPLLYNKSKLVVGVETLPYPRLFKLIMGDYMIDLGGTMSVKKTQSTRDVFTSADGLHSVAPIICYESVYGEYVTGYVQNGADFLAIITNDAWWENTEGHRQHLFYARLRAIETRRSIARAANTGISALINQRGDILQSLPYETGGAIKGTLQANQRITFYTRYGDYIARISILMAVIIFLLGIFGRKKILH